MFAAPPAPAPQVFAPGAVIAWDMQRDGQERVDRSGPYLLRVSAAKAPGAIAATWLPGVEVSDAAVDEADPAPCAVSR